MDHSFRASSCPSLRRTVIDAIDTEVHARPGDAELMPSLLVLECAPQHVAKEFRSILRTPGHTSNSATSSGTAYTQPLDRAYMRAFESSIRSEAAKHFAEFFVEAESNFERVNLDSSTLVLRQLLLIRAQQPHRTQTARNIELLAGASSIGTR